MNIYERYGRLQEALCIENEAHVQTVDVLRKLKIGEIALKQLEVTGSSWMIAPKQETVTEKTPAV